MDWIGNAWSWIFTLEAATWSAAAGWATALIALITVLIAGKYAKKQVEEAKRQVEESRTMRLTQERQARELLAEQARLAQQTLDHAAAEAQRDREEQSQPNVVVFMEPNPAAWESVELAVKNFGSTPAYDIEI